MKNFENQLNEIRIALYEETKNMSKDEIINKINSHTKKIAFEYGFNIKKPIHEDSDVLFVAENTPSYNIRD